jgi:hypothetical protein
MKKRRFRQGSDTRRNARLLAVVKIKFDSGRWAVLAMPYDMTAKEIEVLRDELESMLAEPLKSMHARAYALEATTPRSAEREPWG